MSRNLPPHPNLEHLKKQAKELLHALKQKNPALKLADAQHTLARDYGFASWPKLKEYVESQADKVVLTEQAAAMTNPFVGQWIADLAKSKRPPNNPFQSATLEFRISGDELTILDVVVDETSRENHGRNMILVDGQAHAFDNGYVLVARWRGSHVLETKGKKDGQFAGRGRYEVSPDGQVLTITADEQMVVLDRN